MDGARNVLLHDVQVNDIVNLGSAGSTLCGDYSGTTSHPDATLPGYGGARTRAFSFAGSERVIMAGSEAEDVVAAEGSTLGVDVLTDSRYVFVRNVEVDGLRAGLDGPLAYDGPNETPQAAGFKVSAGARRVALQRVCADVLEAFGDTDVVDDDSGSALVRWICR